ncbi:MAG: glycosyltransferase [Deltaproteobacteria bacterium]|nr:glycosyltransferase [Deltaproteobacteria bacterium]
MTLLRLLTHSANQEFRHRVLSLTAGGTLKPRFLDRGIEVQSLDWSPGRPTPAGLWRLARMVRSQPPDLLLGWMYHANLAASFCRRWACPGVPLVWNIRHTPDDLAREKRLTAAVIRSGARFSKTVTAVVYNSRVSQRMHGALGYGGLRSEVLPNGIDLEAFRPAPEARQEFRRELGLPEDSFLLGRVARFDTMKGYPQLIRAVGGLLGGASSGAPGTATPSSGVLAAKKRSSLHLVLAGRGVEVGQGSLEAEIEAAGLKGRVHLLGERSDVPHLLAALDGFCSSSLFGEGFPNVVAEAMACGVPCVVTDVGDSARVVGTEGWVVPPGQVPALTAALGELLDKPEEERQRMGAGGRRRIADNFAAATVIPRHRDLWLRCLQGPSREMAPESCS